MLTSSPSPTISEAPSSAATFRSYHATYHSPRLYHQSVSSRRPEGGSAASTSTSTPSTTNLALSPSSAVARSSPHLKRQSTADVGTQYTPPDYPPTWTSSFSPTHGASSSNRHPGRTSPQVTRTPTKRRESSAPGATTTTEPPEPEVREDPPRASAAGAQQNEQHANAAPETPALQQQSDLQPGEGGQVSKRARQQDPAKKIMPIAYETCDVKDLGVLISDMLMELVRLNDEIPLKDGQLTRFHSRAPPGISVRDYLTRLIVHATLSPPLLLAMVYYVDRLCALYPAFTISSLTVHRFLITAATVAAKGLSDSFWTNNTYARVGGVSTKELALLELEFLRRLEWRIVPKPEVLVDYYRGLVERGEGFEMERPTNRSAGAIAGV